MNPHQILFSVVSCLLFITSGCFGPKPPDDLPKLYSCKISVVQDSQPLQDAVVLLRPVDGNLRFALGGKTNKNGTAVIKLNGEWGGVPEGDFFVSISKIITPDDLETPGPTTPLRERRRMQKASSEMTKETVDPQYSDLVKTTLRLKVDQKSTHETFDVGKSVNLSLTELFPNTPQL